MTTITHRIGLGRNLTAAEVDANFDAVVAELHASPIATLTANATLGATHTTALVDATTGPVVITLPTAASAYANGIGRALNVKKIDVSANTVTVGSAGLIDGAATQVLTAQWQVITVQSNGTTWSIL